MRLLAFCTVHEFDTVLEYQAPFVVVIHADLSAEASDAWQTIFGEALTSVEPRLDEVFQCAFEDRFSADPHGLHSDPI